MEKQRYFNEQLEISVNELISFEKLQNDDKRKIVKLFGIFWGDLVDIEQFTAVLQCNMSFYGRKGPEILKIFKNIPSLTFCDFILMLDYDGKVK